MDAELTAPAAQLFGSEASPGLVSDGVAVWRDWMPLGGAWGLESLAKERLVGLGMWIALLFALYGLGGVVGLTPWGRVLVVALVAAHPVSAALYGDLAGRGLLAAGALMVFATMLAWTPVGHSVASADYPRSRWIPLACVSLLACLAHPIALVLPVALIISTWLAPHQLLGTRVHRNALLGVSVPAALVVLVRWLRDLPVDVELSRHGAVVGDEVPPLAGLELVGRALEGLNPLALPIRKPCDVDLASAGLESFGVWVGGAVLLSLPMIARRLTSPALSLGLWWLWALLVACSQIAEPLASELAPGMLAIAWLGAALVLGATLDRDKVSLGGLVVAVVVGAWMIPQARQAFVSEDAALRTRVDVCGASVDPRVQLARQKAISGDAREALDLLEGLEGDEVVATRFEIYLAKRSWGPLRRELRRLDGDAALMWRCRVAAAMSELNTVTACAAAREALGDLPELVAAHVIGLARDRRITEAEELARAQLVAQPGETILYDALVTVLEKQGWMRESVEVLEEWYASEATSEQVKLRLGAALVNKGKGDLVQGRAKEAKEAFLRGLELQPNRHELRYHLARALRDLGDREGALRELRRAKDSGAKRPISPLQMRDMPSIPEL